MGRALATDYGRIEQHATLDNGDRSLDDANRQRKSDAIDFLKPRIQGTKDLTAVYIKEAIKRQQELNDLCRRNTAQAQMRQSKKYEERILQAKPYIWDILSD